MGVTPVVLPLCAPRRSLLLFFPLISRNWGWLSAHVAISHPQFRSGVGRSLGGCGVGVTILGMDVTPQVLHDVEFREAKRGGYNTQDVDEFLERLAVGLERLDAQLREARQRAEAAEARIAAVAQRDRKSTRLKSSH